MIEGRSDEIAVKSDVVAFTVVNTALSQRRSSLRPYFSNQ